MKLAWIKEAAPALDPADPQLAPHMRGVLAQLLERLQGAQVNKHCDTLSNTVVLCWFIKIL